MVKKNIYMLTVKCWYGKNYQTYTTFRDALYAASDWQKAEKGCVCNIKSGTLSIPSYMAKFF